MPTVTSCNPSSTALVITPRTEPVKNDATDAKPAMTDASGKGGRTGVMTDAMTATTGAADFPGLFPPRAPGNNAGVRHAGLPQIIETGVK